MWRAVVAGGAQGKCSRSTVTWGQRHPHSAAAAAAAAAAAVYSPCAQAAPPSVARRTRAPWPNSCAWGRMSSGLHAQALCWSCTCSTLKLLLCSCGTPGRPVRCVREDWGMEGRGEGRAVFTHLVACPQESSERILAVAVAQLSKRLMRLQFHSYTRRASMPAVTCHCSHLPPLVATLLISAIWKRYFRFHFQSGESIRPPIVVCTQPQLIAHKDTSCGCHLPLPCPPIPAPPPAATSSTHAAATGCQRTLVCGPRS